MQSSQWRRWGRAWSRNESGWWLKWGSRWRRKSNKLWTRPKRNSGAPTAGKRPSSIAAGTRVTAITPVNKPTGQSTWSPAHSPVTETLVAAPNCRLICLGCLPKQVKLRCSCISFLNQFCKQLQHPFSYFRLCFSDSHSFTAGDRNGAQLGHFGQTIGSLSRYTAPSGRVHIRQKQLSLVCRKKQRQRWSYCNLTATLQIRLKDFGLAPQTQMARPCLCATNHLLVLTPHIYFVYIFFFNLFFFGSWLPQVCVQVVSPCESSVEK